MKITVDMAFNIHQKHCHFSRTITPVSPESVPSEGITHPRSWRFPRKDLLPVETNKMKKSTVRRLYFLHVTSGHNDLATENKISKFGTTLFGYIRSKFKVIFSPNCHALHI